MTKRLFAYIGLTMLITFSVVFYFGYYGSVFTLVFAAGLILLSILLKKLKNNRRVYVLVGIIIILSTFYLNVYNSIFEIKTEQYNDKACTVSGILTNHRTAYDHYFYELDCDKVDGNEANCRVVIMTAVDMGAELGDRINCGVTLRRVSNNYYKSRRFDYNGYNDGYTFDYTVESAKYTDIRIFPAVLREKLTYVHKVLISGYEGELCSAISLGDKYTLSPELYDAFKSTGLSYIIVISGMHMSIVASYIMMLTGAFKKRRFGRIAGYIITVSCILIYVAVTGCSVSAMRSGIMILVLITGSLFKRHSDVFNNLGLAAMLLTVINPFSVGDVGMLMSFASVAGIVWGLPKFSDVFDRKFYKRNINLFFLEHSAVNRIDKIRIAAELFSIRALRYIYLIFAASICAVVAISPITLLFFGICNPLVFIYSILISPFVGGLMVFSILTSVLWYIPILNLLTLGTAFISKVIGKWIVFAVNGIADIPFITFYSSPLYMKLWFGITIVFIAAALMFKNRRKSVVAALLISAAMLALNYSAGLLLKSNKTELTVYSAGEGTCVSLNSPKGMDVLSSGGSRYNFDSLSERLHNNSYKINTLIIPAAREKREMGCAENILDEFDVEKVLLYYRFNTNERVYRKARECKYYNEFEEDKSVSVKLTDTVTDEIVNIKNHTWQYVTDGMISVLIAPYKGDAGVIPEEYCSPDYLIACGNIENIGALNYGEIVWTSSDYPPKMYRNVSFAQNGEFKIEFK